MTARKLVPFMLIAFYLTLTATILLSTPPPIPSAPPSSEDDTLKAVVRFQARQPVSPTETRLHNGSAVAVSHSQGGTDLVTAEHIVSGLTPASATFTITTTDGTSHPVSLVRSNPRHDLALLRLEKHQLPLCPLAPQQHRPSQEILSVGYDDVRQRTSDGKPALTQVVEPARITGYDELCWFTDTQAEGGRSGGGLIDRKQGLLLGIVSRGTAPVGNGPNDFVWPSKRGLYIHRDRIEEILLPRKDK